MKRQSGFTCLITPLFCFLLSLPHAAFVEAQEAVLIKDVNTSPRALLSFDNCALGDQRVFAFDDGVRGAELWIGDGLAGSTRLIKDINPGPGSSVDGESCVEINGVLFFPAFEKTDGFELWRTDGTEAGTSLVADIRPGEESSSPGDLLAFGDTLLFTAKTDGEGNELWKSDGTEAGTVIVRNIRAGADDSDPRDLAVLSASKVLFTASTVAEGRELFETDGTEAGTKLLVDIYAGATGSSPNNLVPLNGKILFDANTAAEGRELWTTDGSAAGTMLVKDVYAGNQSGVTLSSYAIVNNKIAFVGNDAANGREPWITDGTAAGTQLIDDIHPGANSSFPADFTSFSDQVFFTASSPANGDELWSTDGMTAVQQTEISAGADSGVKKNNGLTTSLDGKMLFFEGSSIDRGGNQLYSTDGTPFAVTKLLDIAPGAPELRLRKGDSALEEGVPVLAPQPVSSLSYTTFFLSDGTADGTTLHPGTLQGYTGSSTPIILGTLGGKAIFAADDSEHGIELWSTDGSAAGTMLIKDSNAGFGWSVIPTSGGAVVGDKLLFVGISEAEGAELWITDGTTEGTNLLKDINPGSASAFAVGSSFRKFFFVLPEVGDEVVLFAATTDAEGTELWISDGTAAGTKLLKDIDPGAGHGVTNGNLQAVVTSNGAFLVFVASNGAVGNELWGSDGTTGGTLLLQDIRAGAISGSISNLTAIPTVAKGAVFSANDGASGSELWYYNGATTTQVKDIRAGSNSSNLNDFAVLTNPTVRVLFSANEGTMGNELWMSNLTGAGTVLVKDILPGADGSNPREMFAVSDSMIAFRACSRPSSKDCEPWKSDGTAGGTVLIKDIATETAEDSSEPGTFAALGTDVYFLANESDESNIPRIFRSDLTAAGTEQLADQGESYFAAQALPTYFHPYTPAGGDPTLLFPFTNLSLGFELHKIADDECPDDASKTSGGLCGCNVVDGDADGDGAVDCLEDCPEDPAKQAEGICGCGVADVDNNGNGVFDCLDDEVSTITPPKPTFTRLRKKKKKKKRFMVNLTQRDGVVYVFERRVLKRSASRKKKKWKSEILTEPSFQFRKRKGKKYQFRYSYQAVGIESIQSAVSPIAKK